MPLPPEETQAPAAAPTADLPPGVHFIERDWLCANHILFARPDEPATLIDSGYLSSTPETLDRLAQALGPRPLERLINTHIHSDHIGGNATLARRYPGLEILVPEGEVPALERWDSPAQMLSYADQQADPFAWHRTLEPGECLPLGGTLWEVVASPGHDMGSIVLYCPRWRCLISADALWENGFGFVLPQAIDPAPLAEQRATLQRLNELSIELVLPGHGPAFRDVRGALARAQARLEAFAADDGRLARSVARGMFVFALLWRKRLPLAELPAYVRRVGIHRDLNAQCFRYSDEAYAHWLIEQACTTGRATIEGDTLVSLTPSVAPPRAA
ncbi:MAG: MBL fold metallo-hydrolase [Casimicrobiaceae bacterium]|nr:MBL fold metallo-hydrolase [Casimicrobiaceae bacterium]MCX8098128.1 MBL fold metallo-hydrolase [Casimicrobiaceae bacterium]MDW8311666.1 MBL fold metallo-hydrolase [Burkholderiales bacterium]